MARGQLLTTAVEATEAVNRVVIALVLQGMVQRMRNTLLRARAQTLVHARSVADGGMNSL